MEEIGLKWTEDRIRNEAAKEKELFVKTIEHTLKIPSLLYMKFNKTFGLFYKRQFSIKKVL